MRIIDVTSVRIPTLGGGTELWGTARNMSEADILERIAAAIRRIDELETAVRNARELLDKPRPPPASLSLVG